MTRNHIYKEIQLISNPATKIWIKNVLGARRKIIFCIFEKSRFFIFWHFWQKNRKMLKAVFWATTLDILPCLESHPTRMRQIARIWQCLGHSMMTCWSAWVTSTCGYTHSCCPAVRGNPQTLGLRKVPTPCWKSWKELPFDLSRHSSQGRRSYTLQDEVVEV